MRELLSAVATATLTSIGISAIDTPMLELAVALRETSTARTGQAFSDAVQACAAHGS